MDLMTSMLMGQLRNSNPNAYQELSQLMNSGKSPEQVLNELLQSGRFNQQQLNQAREYMSNNTDTPKTKHF